ncbi:MAG: hypothetical protein WA254_13400 [Candidatus Sulfotelmatobacter sp.]
MLIDMPGPNDPVKIVSVMDGTTELKSNGRQYPDRYAWETTFNAGDDWLKDLSIVIKNVSPKKIVYVAAGCHLFETADWQAEAAKHRNIPLVGSTGNHVGRRPEEALYSAVLGHRLQPDTANAPFDLEPSQEFTMALDSPDAYSTLKSSVEEKEPMSSIAACNGGISQVFFEDGTQWQSHHYLRADLDQRGRWIRMSFEEWSKYH